MKNIKCVYAWEIFTRSLIFRSFFLSIFFSFFFLALCSLFSSISHILLCINRSFLLCVTKAWLDDWNGIQLPNVSLHKEYHGHEHDAWMRVENQNEKIPGYIFSVRLLFSSSSSFCYWLIKKYWITFVESLLGSLRVYCVVWWMCGWLTFLINAWCVYVLSVHLLVIGSYGNSDRCVCCAGCI